MTWYKCSSTTSSNWVNDFDPNSFKRGCMGSFDSSEDIKKETKPPTEIVYFNPEELVYD